jgi:hypothetical protein
MSGGRMVVGGSEKCRKSKIKGAEISSRGQNTVYRENNVSGTNIV